MKKLFALSVLVLFAGQAVACNKNAVAQALSEAKRTVAVQRQPLVLVEQTPAVLLPPISAVNLGTEIVAVTRHRRAGLSIGVSGPFGGFAGVQVGGRGYATTTVRSQGLGINSHGAGVKSQYSGGRAGGGCKG